MGKTLIISTGLSGILNASYRLASLQISKGDECVICCPSDVGEKVRAQGFGFIQLDPINFDPAPEVPIFEGALSRIKRFYYKINNRKIRRKKAISSLGMKSFLEKIKTINPELILIDIELHEHIMTLFVNGYNIRLLTQWFSTWKRKGLPPIVTDIIPGHGFRGSKVGIALAWQKIKFVRWWMFFKRRVMSVGTDRRSILLKYADKIGFSRKYIRENFWPGPFSYDLLPVLSMTNKELEFPHDYRPNLSYIGSMVYENRVDIECPKEVRYQIDEIIVKAKNDKRKLIYCSLSTFKPGDLSFLKKVIKAVESQLGWILMIGLGGKLDEFHDVPENVFLFKYVSQIQVLQKADLSINHGGIHTINECLHFGVPMLIYSGKRSDQNGCAARMHYHGKGIMADKDEDDPIAIRRKISKLLFN